MNRLSQKRTRRSRLGIGTSKGSRGRHAEASWHRPGSLLEILEDRTLLSILTIDSIGNLTYDPAAAAGALAVSVNAGTYTFTDADQTITLSGPGTANWTLSNNNKTAMGPVGSVTSIEVRGTPADESLTLDYTHGDPLPSTGLTYDPPPAAPGASHSIALQSGSGGTTFTSEVYTATGPGAGTITNNGTKTITFSNLSTMTDTVASPTFVFNPPAGSTTVRVVNGAVVSGMQTTRINDGGTSSFGTIAFANKTAATVNVPSSGAAATVNVTLSPAGLSTLNLVSGSGNETINVQATPSTVTTNTDTGSGANSTTNVGFQGILTGINGPVFVKSTGGSNTLAIDDSGELAAQIYAIASSRVTASSFPAFIDFSGGGIARLNLLASGGATVGLTGPAQSNISTYNLIGGTGLGPNTLNVTSNVPTLDFATAGVLTFGAGQPTIDYNNFQSANVTKPAAPPAGTGTTIAATEGQALSNGVVATFTESDLGNLTNNFAASINWGDNTPASIGTIQPNGGSNGYNILGSHTFAVAGTDTVDVTLTDLGSTGSTTVGGATIHVMSTGPVNSTPNPIVSTAAVAAAPLTAQGTTLQGIEGNPLNPASGGDVLVATFMDTGSPGAPTAYTASIDWSDGTAAMAATRITSQVTPNGTVFSVFGNHTYANVGTYPVTVTITKPPAAGSNEPAPGARVIASSQAVIANVALTVTGKLNPASDSGASNSDHITNVVQPNFLGTTSEPNAAVSLYAQPTSGGPIVLIGQGVSNANGAWSITANQALADGSSRITAVAVDRSGRTNSTTTTIVPNLVIDTAGPKVTKVAFKRFKGQIQVTFLDDGGPGGAGVGLNPATVIDANNYSLTRVHNPRFGAFRVNVISVRPGTTTGAQTATLSINRGHKIRGGSFSFRIRSASPANLTGIQDIAGNALDGEFHGAFPSGNNRPGGDFVALVTALHRTILAPATKVGRATPVSRPGTLGPNVTVPTTFNPSRLSPRSIVVAKAAGSAKVAGTSTPAGRGHGRSGAHDVFDKALDRLEFHNSRRS